MSVVQVDVAIIGAGTAGLNARHEAERAGKTWVIIEESYYGTTCARVGCMPSKLLIAAADAAHDAHRASMFGVNISASAIEVDGRAVMKRVRDERDRFVGFVVAATESIPQEKRLWGHATFLDATTLDVGGHTRVEAKTVVVATGSSPWTPPMYEGLTQHLMVNDDVFDMEDLPESVAVVGTGVIGLELGQALHRLGVRVTLFNIFKQVGFLSDPEVHAKAIEVLGRELDLQLGVEVLSVSEDEGGVHMKWRDEHGDAHERTYAKLLSAAGRRANLSGLGLESTGIAMNERGQPIIDPATMQVGDAPIFFAGDVTGTRTLLHEASDEGRIAGYNAAHYPGPPLDAVRRSELGVAFTHPQMGVVGTRYADLDPDEIVVGEVSYDDQGRARVMGINAGLVRVYARKSDCVLVGAEMFGPRVEHTAHLLAWSIQDEHTVHRILRFPFYHPVIEEGIRTALRDAAAQLRVEGRCPVEDFAFGPGG